MSASPLDNYLMCVLYCTRNLRLAPTTANSVDGNCFDSIDNPSQEQEKEPPVTNADTFGSGGGTD